ncbi:MAG: CHAP domain-containing protein [Candidatus Aenigmatarchaeota archaeon]
MENKLKNFISKWLNKYLEVVDPTNKNQCFDLIVAWCDELGIPRVFSHLYAYQIYTVDTDDKKKYFDKIPNTADAYPQAGDIVVWAKTYNGTAGHTAIATGLHQTQGKSTDWFEAFSQNDPVGSPCILKKYSYNHVLGWLRPKKEMIKIDDYYKGLDLNNKESMKACVDIWHEVMIEKKWVKKEEAEMQIKEKEIYYQNELSKKDQTITNLNQQISSLTANLNQVRSEKDILANNLTSCQNLLKEKEDVFNKLNQEIEALRQDKIQLEKFKADWQLKEIEYQKQIKTLEAKLKLSKNSLKSLIIDYIIKNRNI